MNELTLDGLNDRQKEATITTEGPMLVIAGAGSGKTRVLTHRIAYIISQDLAKPWEILAITFTNKASKEMQERMAKIIGENRAKSVWISTFHSMCVRILRKDIDKIGYSKNFTIYDESDKKKIIKDCMRKLDYDEKDLKIKNISAYISDNKNRFVSVNEALEEAEGNFFEERKAKLYKEYQNNLKENSSLDFDDLLVKTVELFKSNTEVLESYQERFKYVLVDEYQDTNKVQYQLVKMLSDKYKNIFVVGDDDQSIYGWRGADISNILNFEDDYSNAKVVKLEQNYRSTQNILSEANYVIKNNTERKDKNLWSDNGDGSKIKLFTAINDKQEAIFVVNEIKRLVDSGEKSYSDFAIMYRTNAQSRAFEEIISKYNMPYNVFGSVKFYDRKEIKDVMAYLNAIVNDKDSVSLKRIINVPKRKIGDTSIQNLSDVAERDGLSFYDVLLHAKQYPELSKVASKVESFTNLIEELKLKNEQVKQGNMKISELALDLLEKINFRDMLREEAESDEEADDRINNVEELISKIAYYEESNENPTLEDFLAEVMLMSDSDNLKETDNYIKLMTIHVAKGLEFDTVFIAGFEDGLFPSVMDMFEDPEELEEERRLLYVAITRAKKDLYITNAKQRMKFGQIDVSLPSRFLDEFDMSLCETIENKEQKRMEEEKEKMQSKAMELYNEGMQDAHLSSFEGYDRKPSFATISSQTQKAKETASASSDDFNKLVNLFDVNDKIEHTKFGVGTIKEIASIDKLTKSFLIDFEATGEKKIMFNAITSKNLKKI